MEDLKKLLNRMIEILEEEKQALVKNDGERIVEIVEDKNKFLEELSEYKGRDFGKNSEILKLIERINEAQETNLMLTNQALNYNNLFIEALKDLSSEKTSGYSKDGKLSKTRNRSIVDQSI